MRKNVPKTTKANHGQFTAAAATTDYKRKLEQSLAACAKWPK